MPRPKPGEPRHRTGPDADGVVRRMAGGWPDHEIAACLNRLRLHTGAGNTWTASRVLSVRKRLRLVDYDETAAPPRLTLYQAADRLGVGPWVVRQLIRRGRLEATQVVPCAPWQIDPARLDTEAVRRAAKAVGRSRPRLGPDPTGWLRQSVGCPLGCSVFGHGPRRGAMELDSFTTNSALQGSYAGPQAISRSWATFLSLRSSVQRRARATRAAARRLTSTQPSPRPQSRRSDTSAIASPWVTGVIRGGVCMSVSTSLRRGNVPHASSPRTNYIRSRSSGTPRRHRTIGRPARSID